MGTSRLCRLTGGRCSLGRKEARFSAEPHSCAPAPGCPPETSAGVQHVRPAPAFLAGSRSGLLEWSLVPCLHGSFAPLLRFMVPWVCACKVFLKQLVSALYLKAVYSAPRTGQTVSPFSPPAPLRCFPEKKTPGRRRSSLSRVQPGTNISIILRLYSTKNDHRPETNAPAHDPRHILCSPFQYCPQQSQRNMELSQRMSSQAQLLREPLPEVESCGGRRVGAGLTGRRHGTI